MQRTKINSEYTSWEEIMFGVPQRSILGPLLFNIFFWSIPYCGNIDISSYADCYTPYTPGNLIEEVIQKFENAAPSFFQWFSDNQMKANLMKAKADKCHFLCNSNSEVSLTIETQINKQTNKKTVNSSNCLVLNWIQNLTSTSYSWHLSKSRTETKCNIYDNTLHGFCEKAFTSKCVFLFTIWTCHNRTNNN